MLHAIMRFGRRFAAPTFNRCRSFGGSVVLTCHQTGEAYSIIPAGPVGFHVAGTGRYIAHALNHSDAVDIIERDARGALRSLKLAA